jgi:2-polyprenyl-3-methyl-5-hydroxy-6-metoxy-1,4-benzoquinol methylase
MNRRWRFEPPRSHQAPTARLARPAQHTDRQSPAMNVDPAELQKFGELAHRWWDPTGSLRPLHEINPLRLDWIDHRGALSGKRVLDVGCGGGILSESMSGRGADVLGIDLADKPLRVAQLHALKSGARVRYRMVSTEELAQEAAASFDVVIRPSELVRSARESDLEVEELRGMSYRPLGRTYVLGTDTRVNYLMACRKTS